MASKKSQVISKPVEIKLDIETNWAKSSKTVSSNLGLIRNNKYKNI